MESHTSSGAANRTSTGNGTCSPDRSSHASMLDSTSTRCSRGTAYSISRNRTRRDVTNTWCDGATYVRGASARAETALRRGVTRGTAVASRFTSSNAPFDRSSSSTHVRARATGPGPVVRSRSSSTASSSGARRLLRLVSARRVWGNQ
ncbi:Uncharacterised protein [Mycobacteroides abscessus]|nr:Uncharacterised protein [Mycobacteroides abscessus]